MLCIMNILNLKSIRDGEKKFKLGRDQRYRNQIAASSKVRGIVS